MSDIKKEILLYIKEHAEEAEQNPWGILYNFFYHEARLRYSDYDWESQELYKALRKLAPDIFVGSAAALWDAQIDQDKFLEEFIFEDEGDPPSTFEEFVIWWEDHDEGYCPSYTPMLYLPKISANPVSKDSVFIWYWIYYLDNGANYSGFLQDDFMRSADEFGIDHWNFKEF